MINYQKSQKQEMPPRKSNKSQTDAYSYRIGGKTESVTRVTNMSNK